MPISPSSSLRYWHFPSLRSAGTDSPPCPYPRRQWLCWAPAWTSSCCRWASPSSAVSSRASRCSKSPRWRTSPATPPASFYYWQWRSACRPARSSAAAAGCGSAFPMIGRLAERRILVARVLAGCPVEVSEMVLVYKSILCWEGFK